MFSHILGIKAAIRILIVWEDRLFHNKSLFLLLYQLFLLSMTPYGTEYHFGRFRSAALVMSPLHFLLLPHPYWLRGWGVGVGECLDVALALLNNRQNIGVISMLF